jgi:hypothetical protein
MGAIVRVNLPLLPLPLDLPDLQPNHGQNFGDYYPELEDLDWNNHYGPPDLSTTSSRSSTRSPSPPPRTFIAPALPDEIFTLVNSLLIQDPGLEGDIEDRPSVVIPAFREKSYVRHAYVQAVIANIFGHLPWDRAGAQLNGSLDLLSMTGTLPTHPQPVRSLISARRRLGMDPDQWITQYAACPSCWKHHSPKELLSLASPDCTVPNCTGTIYKVDQKGKRVANFIIPHVSIIESLRRMFMRPGFAKMVEKKVDHQPGRNLDENFVMKDIHDGDMWYETTTGTVREVGDRGTVRDIPGNGQPEATKLSSHRFGLQLTINMDWYSKHLQFYCADVELQVWGVSGASAFNWPDIYIDQQPPAQSAISPNERHLHRNNAGTTRAKSAATESRL